jgi:hypothetical protein
MLAEKIYKIRQELEEKKSRRLNALQQPEQWMDGPTVERIG